MKNLEEIRGLGVEEINKEIQKAQKDLLEVSIKIESGQEKNTSKKPKYKKYIAQLKTLLNEKSNQTS